MSRERYGASKLGSGDRGCEYVVKSKGCEDEDTAFCAEGALGTGWLFCDQATGARIATSNKAVARCSVLPRVVLGIRFISMY